MAKQRRLRALSPNATLGKAAAEDREAKPAKLLHVTFKVRVMLPGNPVLVGEFRPDEFERVARDGDALIVEQGSEATMIPMSNVAGMMFER